MHRHNAPHTPAAAPAAQQNWLDRDNIALARELADRQQAWKSCTRRACKRARLCAADVQIGWQGGVPLCQQALMPQRVDDRDDTLVRKLLAGFAINEALRERLATHEK